MQAKLFDHNLKLFTCQFHPSETIERVCIDPDTESSLQCIECVLQNKLQKKRDTFCSLVDFIDHAIDQYAKRQLTLCFIGDPPSNLVNFLIYEEKKTKFFANHIEKEKAKVNESFNLILQELTLLCHGKKEEILAKLDMQLLFLKNNYANYKSKIDKYFKKHREEEEKLDKDSLIQKINGCKDTLEMEILVRNIKEDILRFKSSEDHESKIQEIKTELSTFADELNNQSNLTPRPLVNDSASTEQFHYEVKLLMDKLLEFQDSVVDISGAKLLVDSKIITSTHGVKLIKKWLSSSFKFPHLRLLYRGTRDGFDNQIFRKRCSEYSSTLTIAKSAHYGKTFGGYSDQRWEDDGRDGYKQSNNCWLFSIDHKEKYPVKSSTQAIHTSQTHGPTFGAHPADLRLNMTKDSLSSSNLGHSYKFSSIDQYRLAGSNIFSLSEIEVFEVRGQPVDDPSPVADSVLLDSFSYLKLVQNWITEGIKANKTGKLKKVKLQLLYRGSRDGFEAQAFHNYCDNQGPTVVVCKSADHDHIFGGFTSENWSQRNTCFQDKSAFLFSVTRKTKHPIFDFDHAIFCNGRTGPIFGKGHDLFIDGHNSEESLSNLGKSFAFRETAGDPKKYLAGAAKFKLQEMEVFRVIKKV